MVCSRVAYFRQHLGLTDRTNLLEVGEAIRRRRSVLRLSQERLAERASSHRNYVGFLEQGGRSASLMTMFNLACALELNRSELFDEDGVSSRSEDR